jgi:hypothetical protein
MDTLPLGTTGMRRRYLIFIAACVSTLTVACGGPARDARKTLAQLDRTSALHVVPPRGQFLGRGVDMGSRSGINGRAPQVSAVYATSEVPASVASYYLRAYPAYHLATVAPPAPRSIELLGHDGVAIILIDISPLRPDLPQHMTLHLEQPGPGRTTFIVVNALGKEY